MILFGSNSLLEAMYAPVIGNLWNSSQINCY